MFFSQDGLCAKVQGGCFRLLQKKIKLTEVPETPSTAAHKQCQYRERSVYIHIYIYTHMYVFDIDMYIYIYMHVSDLPTYLPLHRPQKKKRDAAPLLTR